MADKKTKHSRIVQDPAVMVGKPVVAGTRIPVERVIAHLARNPELDDLFTAYPELTTEDVKACLAYAHTALEHGSIGQAGISYRRARRRPSLACLVAGSRS